MPPAVEASKTDLMIELHKTLLDLHARNTPAALVVDEAQSVPPNLLREIRLLANLEVGTHKLLPIVLAGQPELADVLNQPRFQPLKQRVAYGCTLDRLDARRNGVVSWCSASDRSGGNAISFSLEVPYWSIHERSRGIPRTINVICNNSLIAGFARGERPVGSSSRVKCAIISTSSAMKFQQPAAGAKTPVSRSPMRLRVSQAGARMYTGARWWSGCCAVADARRNGMFSPPRPTRTSSPLPPPSARPPVRFPETAPSGSGGA